MSILKSVYHAVIDSPPVQLTSAALVRLLPEPHITLSSHEITVPGLPASAAGLRILHISDLHWRAGSELARELPDLAATVPHDLALYTGDFIDDDDGIEPVTSLLARMPRVDGAYAVLGNHDYLPWGRTQGRNDAYRLRAALAGAGLEVLCNTARPLCGGELFVAGVDDPATYRDDLDATMSGIPAGACSLLLAHSPDILLRLGTHRPGLVLAGHTHGGQIRLPLIGPIKTESKVPRRWAMGFFEHEGIPAFVTRGIGYSGLNLRVGCPAEIALITLRSPLAVECAA